MSGVIEKGTISNIDGDKVRVSPCAASSRVSAQIIIPWHLRSSSGNLAKGTEVVYVLFDDQTGILLGRMDGDWGNWLPNLTINDNLDVGGDTSIKGDTTSSGNLDVGANASIVGNVSADGNASIAGDISTDKNLTVKGNGAITGNISSNGNLSADGNISSNGNITATADVKVGTINLKSHIHGGVTIGTESTDVPQ